MVNNNSPWFSVGKDRREEKVDYDPVKILDPAPDKYTVLSILLNLTNSELKSMAIPHIYDYFNTRSSAIAERPRDASCC